MQTLRNPDSTKPRDKFLISWPLSLAGLSHTELFPSFSFSVQKCARTSVLFYSIYCRLNVS